MYIFSSFKIGRVGDVTMFVSVPLAISTTKRVNTCWIPSPVTGRIHATKWSRALVFVVRGRALHLVAADLFFFERST